MYEALGKDLSFADQDYALRVFVHRFTGDNVPGWSRDLYCGEACNYPLQFRDDKEWLANTLFRVNRSGYLDKRYNTCQSSPTWPGGDPKGVAHG